MKTSIIKYLNKKKDIKSKNDEKSKCKTCKGKGELNGDICPECDGAGYIKEKK